MKFVSCRLVQSVSSKQKSLAEWPRSLDRSAARSAPSKTPDVLVASNLSWHLGSSTCVGRCNPRKEPLLRGSSPRIAVKEATRVSTMRRGSFSTIGSIGLFL